MEQFAHVVLRYEIVKSTHDNKAADTEDLVVNDQFRGYLGFEYPRIIGELVTDGADRGRKNIADQQRQDNFPIAHASSLEQGPGCGKAGREFGGNLQGDYPHGFRGEPGEEGKIGGHHLFHGGEDPCLVEPVNEDVDGNGKADDRADAFFKASPAFLEDGVPAASGLFGALHLHSLFTFRFREDETADKKDGKGAKKAG